MNRQIATHISIKHQKRQLAGLAALALAASVSLALADDRAVAGAVDTPAAVLPEGGSDLEKHGDRFTKAIERREGLKEQPYWSWSDEPAEIRVGSR